MSSPEWSRYVRDELGVPLDPRRDLRPRRRATCSTATRSGCRCSPAPRRRSRGSRARWPLALASSSNKEVIDRVMATSGWGDVFRVWVSSEEVDRGKPAPDVFLEAARRIGVEPADAAGDRGLAQRDPRRARRRAARDRDPEPRVPARRRGARGRRRGARRARRADAGGDRGLNGRLDGPRAPSSRSSVYVRGGSTRTSFPRFSSAASVQAFSICAYEYRVGLCSVSM